MQTKNYQEDTIGRNAAGVARTIRSPPIRARNPLQPLWYRSASQNLPLRDHSVSSAQMTNAMSRSNKPATSRTREGIRRQIHHCRTITVFRFVLVDCLNCEFFSTKMNGNGTLITLAAMLRCCDAAMLRCCDASTLRGFDV